MMRVRHELAEAITHPDDIDSVEVTVDQGLLRRACMGIDDLTVALRNLLNECINYDDGTLPEGVLVEATRLTKQEHTT